MRNRNNEILAVLYSLLYFSVFDITYKNFVNSPVLAMVMAFAVTIVFYFSNLFTFKQK